MLKNVRSHSVKEGEKKFLKRYSKWSLFWTGTHPPSKIHGDLFSRFCVIQTSKHSNRRRLKHDIVGGGNNVNKDVWDDL